MDGVHVLFPAGYRCCIQGPARAVGAGAWGGGNARLYAGGDAGDGEIGLAAGVGVAGGANHPGEYLSFKSAAGDGGDAGDGGAE